MEQHSSYFATLDLILFILLTELIIVISDSKSERKFPPEVAGFEDL